MKMREFEDGCGVSWLNLLAQVFVFMLVFLMTSYTACQCFEERVKSDLFFLSTCKWGLFLEVICCIHPKAF